MPAITFLIHAEQPLLATSFQGDPNSDVSYPYIPGSMIRGALIGRYLKQHRLQDDDIVANESVRQLFFDATTRYLNAYLATGEEEQSRSLPILRSWHHEKGAEAPMNVYDFSLADFSQPGAAPGLTSPKKLERGFCWVEDSKVKLYSVKRRINVHHERDRQRGRATKQRGLDQAEAIGQTKQRGQIFRYDAIDAGQTFQAVVLFDQVQTVEAIVQLLKQNTQLWLGGSQSAGYGKVRISEIRKLEQWQEFQPPDNRMEQKQLCVTLLSDLMLRNSSGQYSVEPPTQALSDDLGLSEPLVLKKSYMGSTVTGGFNRKWGLPLPQIQAIAAGSVFVFDAVSLTSEQIEALEFQGIGERRNEGFGRIAINWIAEAELSAEADAGSSQKISTDSQNELSASSRDLARSMAMRLMRQKLEEWLIAKTNLLELQGDKISNSQLSRLGLIARQSLYQVKAGSEQAGLDTLEHLLDHLPKNARTQFASTKVEGIESSQAQSLDQQIRNWLSLEKRRELFGRIEPIIIANETLDLTDELVTEYTLRLIIAITKKASKEKSHASRTA